MAGQNTPLFPSVLVARCARERPYLPCIHGSPGTGGVGLTPGTPREHMLTWGHHRPPPGASPGHHRGLPIDHPGAARPQVGQTAPLHAPRWGRAPEFTPPGGAVVFQARHSAHDGGHCGSDGAPRRPYAAHPAQCANSIINPISGGFPATCTHTLIHAVVNVP